MKLEKIDFSEADCFSPFFLDYMGGTEALDPFYNRKPSIDSFQEQIRSKPFSDTSRSVLVETLRRQYEGLEISEAVDSHLSKLSSPTTFTITTGHQLNLFTGPLYFIYKIVTVINACKSLKEQYPDYDFVPVYWMASEDHDFDEICYFRFGGKKYEWKSEQTGAVGRFNPKELKDLISEFPASADVFEQAYLKHDNLADAVRYYVNELLGEYGALVIDADDRSFKEQLVPVIKSDLFDSIPEAKVNEANSALTDVGYKPQVHAREVNFFYLEDGLRTRIEREGDTFKLVDSDRKFSRDEIEKLLESSPEVFSPNVILRPLYQEIILPNLAYVGGPSELVYWLQLKGVFDHFEVPFPILMPRNFGLVIPSHLRKKWDKTGLSIGEAFKEDHILAKELTLKYSGKELKLNGKSDAVYSAFDEIQKQAADVDSTLGPMVEAETARMKKSLDKIEKKMIRAEKRRMSDRIGQMESVKDILFPGGGLQERKDNFLNFYLEDGDFIQQLVDNFDGFDFRFHILSYE